METDARGGARHIYVGHLSHLGGEIQRLVIVTGHFTRVGGRKVKPKGFPAGEVLVNCVTRYKKRLHHQLSNDRMQERDHRISVWGFRLVQN